MCVELISKFFKKPTTISLCLGYYNTWMTGSRRSSSKGIMGSWLLKVWSCWYYSHVKPVGLLPSVLSPTSILHINKLHAGTHTPHTPLKIGKRLYQSNSYCKRSGTDWTKNLVVKSPTQVHILLLLTFT
jgi:hypothetical protein